MATLKAEVWLDWPFGSLNVHTLLHSITPLIQEIPPLQCLVHLDLHVTAMLLIEGR